MSSTKFNVEQSVADEFETLKQGNESATETLRRLCNHYTQNGIEDDLRYRSVPVRECMGAIPHIGKDLRVAQEKLITIASHLHRCTSNVRKKELARKLVEPLTAFDRKLNDQVHSDEGRTETPSFQTAWKTVNSSVTRGATADAPLTATTGDEAEAGRIEGGIPNNSAKEES